MNPKMKDLGNTGPLAASEKSSSSESIPAHQPNTTRIEDQLVDITVATQDNDIITTTRSRVSYAQFNGGVEAISMRLDDPEHPFNFTTTKKAWIILIIIFSVFNSTIGSSITAGISQFIAKEWNITNQSYLVLPTSIYLVGYCLGPLLWGPLSEHYGRKWIMVIAFAMFTVFTLACALAPNLAALVVFRLMAGTAAACALTVTGGVCADLFRDAETRGRAFSIWMGVTTFGPTIGPIISGYMSPISWRWSFWISLIFAGMTGALLLLVPETYAPILLVQRAKKLRKETGDDTIRAPMELEKTDVHHIITIVLTRPIRMFCFEPLIFFICTYISFAYAIFYMSFQSYPIIYGGVYGFSAGAVGLTFLPVGVGALIACAFALTWDSVVRRAIAQDKEWIKREEMKRLPLGCMAGPFLVAACFWLGWSSKESIHWIVPVMSGASFGVGLLLLFMSLINYIVDSYHIFAASALAASGTVRSVWGTVLPFAAKPMYEKLGVGWACSLLGFLSLGLATIPFVFIWLGPSLRARSKFCQYLLQKQKEEDERNKPVEEKQSA